MPAEALPPVDQENLIFSDDATDFDVSLLFDGGVEATVVLAQEAAAFHLPVQTAIEMSVAILKQAAPWKLR